MIAIIDYGLGNIKAFVNVFKNLNKDVIIARDSKDLNKVTKIILPGVGSFDHAMRLLLRSGMKELLDELVLEKKIPTMGICVGMQILAKTSEEGKMHGLGWIDGQVKKLKNTTVSDLVYLPHMGWNNINVLRNINLLDDLNPNSYFYFLHSYCFHCNNDSDIIATTTYGEEFSCVVNSKNIYGVQFHPEKSHASGIQLLKNFAELSEC